MKTNGYQSAQRPFQEKCGERGGVERADHSDPFFQQPPASAIVTVPASLLDTIGRADSVYPTTCFPARIVERCQCTCHSLLS
jgi:hypothetical protein